MFGIYLSELTRHITYMVSQLIRLYFKAKLLDLEIRRNLARQRSQEFDADQEKPSREYKEIYIQNIKYTSRKTQMVIKLVSCDRW